jgi:AraC family transcriptional activator of mtrCDE
MLLEKILDHMDVQVDAFALCDVRPGWSLNLVPPKCAVLHFVIAGHGEMKVGSSDSYELSLNRLALVPPGLGHSLRPDGPADRELTADSADIPPHSGVHRIQAGEGPGGVQVACGKVNATYGGVAGLFDHLHTPIDLDFTSSPAMRSAFTGILEEQSRGGPGSDAMTTALMNQAFILLLRELGQNPDEGLLWLEAVADEQLGRAIDAVIERPENPHSVDTLADLAGMSRSTFTDHFRKAFGRSPMDFVRETRLQLAARLLKGTELAIEQIASRVGLQSRSHFSQAFSDYYGVAPARYRSGDTA